MSTDRIGALILAAGGSTRLGQPKQFLHFRGETLIRHAFRAAEDGGCSPIVVVAGTEHARIASELEKFDAQVIHHSQWKLGIGSSIRAGMEHAQSLSPPLDAVLIMVCDQPFVSGDLVRRLIAARTETKKAIVGSCYSATIGVPALFDRSVFPRLVSLPDKRGAKHLISTASDEVEQVDFEEGAIDIDTGADCRAHLDASL